jgi:hypothetical protein
MVVDYRILNKNLVFDAFSMLTFEHVFTNLHNAKLYSVLYLTSAYNQISLSAKSRRAFCMFFGLFELNMLPLGISVGCQVLSRVVDKLFGGLKQKFVYNFMDDPVVYSRSLPEHLGHFAEVFKRLEKAGFSLNPDNLRLGQAEIALIWHLVSGQGVKILPERVEATWTFPYPKNLKGVRRFLGMAGVLWAFH